MNIIIATTELINAYVESLIKSLSGKTLIFEFSSRKVVYDRELNIKSFIYNDGWDQIKKLRSAKKALHEIFQKEDEIEVFFNHPFDLLANYVSKKRGVKCNLIPDGMLNYSGPYFNRGFFDPEVIKRIIKSVFALTFFDAPNGNIFYEGRLRYKYIYAFSEQGLYVPDNAKIKLLDMESCNSQSGRAVFLGQYTSGSKSRLYEEYVLRVLEKESKRFKSIFYRPHPSEKISDNLKEELSYINVRLDESIKVIEFNEGEYSVFIGIFSSPLIHMKLIDEKFRCISYPNDFWGRSDSQISCLVNKMKMFGCEIMSL